MPAVAADESVYTAIADPTRRAILDLLVSGERSVNELVEHFDVTQPAISRHLRILREVGLVRDRAEGRLRIYQLDPEPLSEVVDWLTAYDRFWRKRLKALGDFLDRS